MDDDAAKRISITRIAHRRDVLRTIMTVVVATHGPACDGAITITVNRHLAGVSTTLVIQGLSGSERWTTGGSAMIDTGNRAARTRAHPFLA